MNTKKTAMPPLCCPDSEILILGTMPGERSLAEQQYYANRGNQFWKIMFLLCEADFTLDYDTRRQLLLDRHIALWDVLQSCERKGSLDSNISGEVPNDFAAFFRAQPLVHTVCFSSKNAEKYYERFVGKKEGFRYLAMPSPSGAYPMKFEEKLDKWKLLLESGS